MFFLSFFLAYNNNKTNFVQLSGSHLCVAIKMVVVIQEVYRSETFQSLLRICHGQIPRLHAGFIERNNNIINITEGE